MTSESLTFTHCVDVVPWPYLFNAGQGAHRVRFSSTHAPEFHAKYGTGLMVGGFAFCVSVWGFVCLFFLCCAKL